MRRIRIVLASAVVLGSFLAVQSVAFAATPSAEQALKLTPVQKGVEFDTPSAQEIPKCKITVRKGGGGWIVEDPTGKTLRRFLDTNGDNIVDMWCYYKERRRGLSRHRLELQRQGGPISLVQYRRNALGFGHQRRRRARRVEEHLGGRGDG